MQELEEKFQLIRGNSKNGHLRVPGFSAQGVMQTVVRMIYETRMVKPYQGTNFRNQLLRNRPVGRQTEYEYFDIYFQNKFPYSANLKGSFKRLNGSLYFTQPDWADLSEDESKKLMSLKYQVSKQQVLILPSTYKVLRASAAAYKTPPTRTYNSLPRRPLRQLNFNPLKLND